MDATITNNIEEQIISITESGNSSRKVVAIPVLIVSDQIEVNGTNKISFIEKGLGKYALPATFKAKTENTY